jgi:membrane associated rhomboid family serine protease
MSSGADLFVVCKNCGSEVSPYITECPYCGTRLRKRAPKLDKSGQPKERRMRRARPSLGRLRPGEMPGIRIDDRPWGTLAIIVASVGASLSVQTTWVSRLNLAVVGKPGNEWWRILTAPLVYVNTGYALAALVSIALFGWLLERRHGHITALAVFLISGSAGMALAAGAESIPLAAGGNGAALGMLCAWAVPDLLQRRAGEETESDLLGVAVIAGVIALMPLVALEADWLAGAGGAVAGLACGLLLSTVRRRAG